MDLSNVCCPQSQNAAVADIAAAGVDDFLFELVPFWQVSRPRQPTVPCSSSPPPPKYGENNVAGPIRLLRSRLFLRDLLDDFNRPDTGSCDRGTRRVVAPESMPPGPTVERRM